ncbi:MAG: hypothetical protein A2365_00950 [Candidatus Nealsonbacteria bacterium RIFOXYB1_FULL_40_15]|uniref:DUF4349 domain-containing protein n=1 Tax=Candidatus Nealsonbacteria bacterium RIFOXYB1_FULL_40_15 TaxID=1801677 RepID=A0A1G2ELI3_9BACT|nr:MAG: hypothetical protein A2365_00950 [Candidatus Nealsonbacteria bacterium RIFOXYB1_FULL_40_15]
MDAVPVKDNNSNRKILLFIAGVVVLYVALNLYKSFFGVSLRSFSIPSTTPSYKYSDIGTASLSAPSGYSPEMSLESSVQDSSGTRMVVQTSNLSLLVKDVKDSGDKVLGYTKENGGYMVSTSFNRPTESPYATITIRVPSEKFEDALNYFRSLAIKVANENIQGSDVTDQYEDIEEHLATLTKTKTRLEAIMDMTNDVSEIIRVQKEIISLQTQIDSLIGRKQAIEEEVAMTKITVYLSTDELSLPYTPDEKFRPNVVFKLAVRSLLGTFKGIGEMLIWVAVYSLIWIPAIIIYKLVKKWRMKNKLHNKN